MRILYAHARAGHVDLPSGDGAEEPVRGAAPPQALDERGGGLPSADHVLLPLLLLDFECES